MSNAIAERAAAIRQWRHLRDHPDQTLARRYSFVASRFEQLKLAQLSGDTTPADDQAFLEVSQMLLMLTRQLGLGGDTVSGWRGFLHGDPGRLIDDSFSESHSPTQ